MDKIKELVSQMTNDVFAVHCKWAINFLEKREFAYAAGMFSVLLEECLMIGNKISEEKYRQLHKELEQLVLKFISDEENQENKIEKEKDNEV